jgi:hypothetical protein
MDQATNRQFITRTEALVKPQDVTAISFLGDFNKILPVKAQEKIMLKGSLKVPYMGFIVDPYCFFLAYRIKNRAAAQAMLPEGYELAETSFFKDQAASPLLIIGAFSVRTSAFIGNRLEFYLIARQRDSGRVAWIIADYETNTNTYDPKRGFSGYTCDPAILTTTPYGELLAEFAGKKSGQEFSASADLAKGQWRELNQELWVEGNLSIDYGGELKTGSSKAFSLIFDPFLMQKALNMPADSIEVRKNSYLGSLIGADGLICAAVFPYSQHFVIKQDLAPDAVTDEAGLSRQTEAFLGLAGFKTMSRDDIKKPLLAGMLVSALLTYGTIIVLLLRLLTR